MQLSKNAPSQLACVYIGSVKKVWQPTACKNRLLFEFTDDYSVFDWGKMPDTIANKGRSLAIMAAYFFNKLACPDLFKSLPDSPYLQSFDKTWLAQRWQTSIFKNLCEHGAPHHFKGLVDGGGNNLSVLQAAGNQTVYLEVIRASVIPPQSVKLLSQPLFYYPAINPEINTYLVPLEVVFRFGMPTGSSLKTRLNKDPSYAQMLGLDFIPSEQEMFKHPVLELFTKLEPKDRLLGTSEALHISHLSPQLFDNMTELAWNVALALYHLFAKVGIALWDGKFEFVVHEESLLLADSIGPDELRLIYKGSPLSKEMIRQFYRGSRWEEALKQAQIIATARGVSSWKEICKHELKIEPEHLSPGFKAVVDKLYGVLTNHVVGEVLFADHLSLDEFIDKIPLGT